MVELKIGVIKQNYIFTQSNKQPGVCIYKNFFCELKHIKHM